MKSYVGLLVVGILSAGCHEDTMSEPDMGTPNDLAAPQDLAVMVDAATPAGPSLSLVAGGRGGMGSVDGTGQNAHFNAPTHVAFDGAGNLYIADTDNNTIRKMVIATGVVTTVAGTAGTFGTTDGTGTAARFRSPNGLALDGAGNLYIADADNQLIRKLVLATGVVTTLAGTASTSGSTDGTGTAARFNFPRALVFDGAGNLYIADANNHTIRKVVVSSGVVTTLAGTAGMMGSTNATGTAARFSNPTGLTLDAAGNLYVADSGNNIVRKVVVASGVVTTLAGTAGMAGSTDGTGTAARFSSPNQLSLDSTDNLYVSDTGNYTIRKIVVSTGAVTTLAGTAGMAGSSDGSGAAARFRLPSGLAQDGAGNLYAMDLTNHALRKIVVATGAVTTLAGGAAMPGNTDGTGSAARFNNAYGLVADGAGNLYVGDRGNHVIRKVVVATGVVTTLAGTAGMSGNTDGTGATARFNLPRAVVVDGAGNLYVADASNNTIRKVVVASGMVTTLAGTAGMSGSTDGTGAAARFNNPQGLAIDAAGNLYVSEANNNTIRKVVAASGAVTTLAGTAGTSGSTDGTGTAARFATPQGMALDAAGNLYVAEGNNHSIRKVVVSSGVVTTLAGTSGMPGAADGTGPAARFNSPTGLAVDGTGNVYVADFLNSAVRKIQTSNGSVTTVIGALQERGVALTTLPARLATPSALAVLPTGEIYIFDENSVLVAR